MKIEKVETFFVSRFLVVKVTTEDGIEGIGESCYWSYPKAAEATIPVSYTHLTLPTTPYV